MSTISRIGRDLRYAIRILRSTPSLTSASVLTLAVGIGANTAIFSVVYGVLLRPLPYRDPAALVRLNAVQDSSGQRMNFSLPEFEEWERQTATLQGIALFSTDELSITTRDTSETVTGAYVSSRFFEVLGSRPVLGRLLQPKDDHTATAVLSERVWRRLFGARPDIVGTQVALNGRSYAVVGIAASAFQFPSPDVELWTPLGYAATFAPPRWKMRGYRAFSMIGRLNDGVGVRQAGDDAARIARGLQPVYPRFNANVSAAVTPLAASVTANVRPALLLLFGVVGLVLLIACANLANLSLARSAARARETAIRIAVGASRSHLVGQFVAESAVLAAAGAALGLLFAHACVRALAALRPAGLPRVSEIRLDAPVLAFTFVTAVLATMIFGTVPALTASPARIAGSLGDRSAGLPSRVRRLHAGLIVVEIAVSVTLVITGTLLTRSFIALLHTDIGIHRTNVLTMRLNLGSTAFARPVNQIAFLRRALAVARALPSVESVGTISSLPPSTSQMHTSVSVPNGRTGAQGEVAVEVVAASPGVFATLGVPLIAGRTFEETDTETAPHVVVLGATAARRLFPDGDPLGRTLPFGSTQGAGADPVAVGLVGDVKYSGVDAPPDGALYMPFSQRLFGSTFLVVRTTSDPDGVANSVRHAIMDLEPTIGISAVRPFDTVVSEAIAQPRFRTWLLLLLAGLALSLAMVGLYGVVSYAVGQRTAEIGVRIALGASSSHVLTMVLRQGLTLTAGGIVIGVAGATVLGRTLAAFLYGIGSSDVPSFAIAVATVAAVSVAATVAPAHRATRVDPLTALRAD